jgi:hypothetical protein
MPSLMRFSRGEHLLPGLLQFPTRLGAERSGHHPGRGTATKRSVSAASPSAAEAELMTESQDLNLKGGAAAERCQEESKQG